jgi:hypothetical protein
VITITITGQVGHLGVGRQTAQVEEANLAAYDASSILSDWFVVTSESIVPNNAPLIAEGEIGRGRDRTGAIAGGYGISGGFGGYARTADLGVLLQMAMSDEAASPDGSTGITTVTFTDYLDWWVIERNVGDTLYVWYVNSKVNSLNISVAANQIATYTVDFVITMERDITNEATPLYGTPSFAGDDLLAFHGGHIEIAGSQYSNMESVEIAISNGLSNDEYTVHESRFLNNVTEGSRTIDLNFNQVFQTATDYSTYTYGQAGRTTPGYSMYEDSVYFLLMNAQAKVSATQYVEFFFPRVMFAGLPVNLTNGRIVVANTGTVLAPTEGEIMTVLYK